MPLRQPGTSVLLNRGEVQQKTAPHWFACWYSCAFLLWTLTLPPVSEAGRKEPVWLPLKEASTISELVAASSTLQLKLQASSVQQSNGGTEGDSRRGILVAAGGRDRLATTLVVMKVLRVDLECDLPVEVAYHGEDEYDAAIVQLLKAVDGLIVRDTTQLPYPQHHYNPDEMHGYFKKILAIYTCDFNQILYLDAGSLPLLDPGLMFDWQPFKESGSLFWPDYTGADPKQSPHVDPWTELGLEPPWLQEPGWRSTESGQLLLDRRRHADVLEWLLFLNSHHKVLYGAMPGGKDSFELAFALAGKHSDFRCIKYWPRAALANLSQADRYEHVGILQCDQWGVPSFFHHAAGHKWRLGEDPSEISQAAHFTNGLSMRAGAQLSWHDENRTVALDKARAVESRDVTCKHVDLATALILEGNDRERWEGCRLQMEAWQDVPVPLLAWEWLPQSVINTVSAAFEAFKAVRTLLASMEEKAAAAKPDEKEPEQKEPEQREKTEKKVKEEPRSDDAEERISSEVRYESLQEMLQSKDIIEDHEGDAKGEDVASKGEHNKKDEASEPENSKLDAEDSRKPDSPGARDEDSKQSDSTESTDTSSAQSGDAKIMLDDSRRPAAPSGARSNSQLQSVVKGDGRWLIPGESDRPTGTGRADLEVATRAHRRRGRQDDGGRTEGERLDQRNPEGRLHTAEEGEEDTLDDIQQLGGAVGRVQVNQRESRRQAPDVASGGAGQGSETSQTEPNSVQGSKYKGFKTGEGGNTPGDQANRRHINSSISAQSGLKNARLAKLRSRLSSQRQGGLH